LRGKRLAYGRCGLGWRQASRRSRLQRTGGDAGTVRMYRVLLHIGLPKVINGEKAARLLMESRSRPRPALPSPATPAYLFMRVAANQSNKYDTPHRQAQNSNAAKIRLLLRISSIKSPSTPLSHQARGSKSQSSFAGKKFHPHLLHLSNTRSQTLRPLPFLQFSLLINVPPHPEFGASFNSI
jgi:hypothetical protein